MSVALCPDLVLRVGCGRDVLVPFRARHVEDDLGRLGVFLFGDGGEGAEELVGDVGEDGGTGVWRFYLGRGGGAVARGSR